MMTKDRVVPPASKKNKWRAPLCFVSARLCVVQVSQTTGTSPS